MTRRVRIGVVVGEPSGDLLAAGLLAAMRRSMPGLEAEGIGGPQLARTGFNSLFAMDRLSFMCDVSQLAGRLFELWVLRRRLREHFLEHRPDVFIGVDAPEFNLGLEESLHAHGIRTVHYVSPSVWAWRRYRVRRMARALDRLLILLPFEEEFYQHTDVCARYVGHPVVDRILNDPAAQVGSVAAARAALGLPADGQWVALLPGSRSSELRQLTTPFLQTAAWCLQRNPELRFISSLVGAADVQRLRQERDRQYPGLPLQVFHNRMSEVMCAADAVLLASGTATLEGLLLERPMVVAYRMPWLSYALLRCLVSVRHIALPNLLAGQRLVPEFMQRQVRPEVLGSALLHWLNTPQAVRRLQEQFRGVRDQLGRGADQRAADAVLELLPPVATAGRER